MKKTSHIDKLKILVALSDKLWEDYENTIILEKEYVQKYSQVKKEINNGFLETMNDLDEFARDLGYLIRPIKSFTCKSQDFKINKN